MPRASKINSSIQGEKLEVGEEATWKPNQYDSISVSCLMADFWLDTVLLMLKKKCLQFRLPDSRSPKGTKIIFPSPRDL